MYRFWHSPLLPSSVALLFGSSPVSAKETYILHFDYNAEAASGIADIREKTLKDCARKMLRVIICGGQEIFARRLASTSMFLLVEAPRDEFAVQGFIPKQMFKVKDSGKSKGRLPMVHLDFTSRAQPVCAEVAQVPLTVDQLQNMSMQSRAVASGERGVADFITSTLMGSPVAETKQPLTSGVGQQEQDAQQNGADDPQGDIWFLAKAKIKGF
jgi:hypothetical protein